MARKIFSSLFSPSSCSFDQLSPMALPFCTQIQRRESPSSHSKALKLAAHSTKSGLPTSQDGLCLMSTERAKHWSERNKILTPSTMGYFLKSIISPVDSQEVALEVALLVAFWSPNPYIQCFLLSPPPKDSLLLGLPGGKFPEGLHMWRHSQQRCRDPVNHRVLICLPQSVAILSNDCNQCLDKG